ncbi:MAG: hypothetical protein ABW169_02225 [Sphingobium sp.]
MGEMAGDVQRVGRPLKSIVLARNCPAGRRLKSFTLCRARYKMRVEGAIDARIERRGCEMVTQTERDAGTGGCVWSTIACEKVVPEDVSFLIACEDGNHGFPGQTILANLAILAGVTGFMVLLNTLL